MFYKNAEFYRGQYIINKLQDKLQNEYLQDDKNTSNEDIDKWNKHWDEITRSLVAKYKKTSGYEELNVFLKATEKLYLSQDSENIDLIRKVDALL
ncbi:MAG: hypothetical protein GX671_03900 [Clostridiales bacterium]|nr:hypothetical protein [Clostridiales bacterium]